MQNLRFVGLAEGERFDHMRTETADRENLMLSIEVEKKERRKKKKKISI